MIKPTIGRVVWYKPSTNSGQAGITHGDQVHAALVAYVHSDTCVNLAVFDTHGNNYNLTSVALAQDREAEEGECQWMPYQVGQAAKSQVTA